MYAGLDIRLKFKLFPPFIFRGRFYKTTVTFHYLTGVVLIIAKLSPSSSQVGLTSLISDYYHPHPHPPGK